MNTSRMLNVANLQAKTLPALTVIFIRHAHKLTHIILACLFVLVSAGHIDESTQCFIPRKYITHQVTSPAQELDSHCGLSEGFLRLFSTAGLLEATQTESGEASPRPVSHGYKEKPLPPIPTSTNTWPKSVSGLSLAKGKSQHFSDSAVPATDEQSSVTLDAKVRSQSCSGRQDLRQGLSSSTNNLCKRNEKHLSPQARARSSALSASALRFSDTIHPLALADMSSASAANQASAGDEEEEEDPFTSSDEISPYAQTGARVFLPAKNEAPVVPSTHDYLEIEDLAPNHAEFLPRLRSTGFFVTGNGDESPKPPPRSHLQDIAPSRRTPADSATPPPVPKKKKKDKMQENSATLQSTSNSSKIYEHLV